NIDALRGSPCALADAVMVEADPNTGLLTPADVAGQNNPSAGAALAGRGMSGFDPDGVSTDLESDADSGGGSSDADAD
ncbi:hypothetical protein G3I15_21810, partial [Streptomyces sp. SID10244]|nr:hypothetical protein [Streptomyces sp. SID10244]